VAGDSLSPAQLPSESRAARIRLASRLVVFCAALLILGGDAAGKYTPNRWLYADGSFYYNILKGVMQNGSLDQGHIHPRTWFNGTLGWNYNLTDDWSNISVGRGGTWYPKHAFLMPLLALPFYLAFGPVGTLIFNVLCGALTALLAAELASRFTARWLASLIGIGMAGVPAIVRQAYGFNNDVFYTVLVVATAIELVDRRDGRAGLWGGFSVLAKITNVIFLLPFGLWVLATRDRRGIARFIGAASVGIGLAAVANWVMFGAPWVTPYQRVLIVHNGVDEIQSHFRLFSRDFSLGLAAIWTQVRQTLPAYLVAFAGCAALAWRKRVAEALVFAAALILPLLFFAKYAWYREEFLDPSFALCAAPLGALGGLLFAPQSEPRASARVWRLGLGTAFAALAVLSLGRGALALADRTLTLAKLVPDSSATQVFLGEVPCDYFNNQVGRWECSGFDRGQEWCFTGQTLDRFPRFGGVERAPIDLNPHPSGQPRRLVFTPIWRRHLVFGFGLSDGSAALPVELSVTLGGQEVLRETVSTPGWQTRALDTPAGSRIPLEITVTGQAAPNRQLYVDGELTN
jgi:hypothetical protein